MSPRVAVVGATGAVGEVMRQLLAERSFPLSSITFLASERSAGKPVEFAGIVGERRRRARLEGRPMSQLDRR